jgi:hypothetical protein
MTVWKGRFYYLDQLISAQLGQDWRQDFDDPWEAGEAVVTEADNDFLASVTANIDTLRGTYTSPEARFEHYNVRSAFHNAAEFDTWLTDLDRRITQAIAGIHNEPMVDPRPPLPPDGGSDAAAWPS